MYTVSIDGLSLHVIEKGGFDRHIAVHGELDNEYQFCSTCVVRCGFEWTRPDVKLQRATHRRVHCSLDLRWRFDPSEVISSNLYSLLLHQMGEKAQRLNICPCIVENAGSASTIIQSDRNGDDLVPYRTVVDVFINKTDVGEHSFHLHSHTFEILSTSPTISKRNLYTLIHIMVCTSFHYRVEWQMSTELAMAFPVSSEQLLANDYTASPSQKTTVRNNLFLLK